jgi:hypothetical protein
MLPSPPTPWRMDVDSDVGIASRLAVPVVAIHPRIVAKPRIALRAIMEEVIAMI